MPAFCGDLGDLLPLFFFCLFTQSQRLQIKIDALELKTSSSNLELRRNNL